MTERPKQIWDFYSYFEQQLLEAGYNEEDVKEWFETYRRNSEKYQQLPEGDSWYKRVLLKELFEPMLRNGKRTDSTT